ncbi:MAG: hypothetical protein MUE66_06375 [Acidimicrobiia bacterium]|jgi:Ca2+-binding RTX toxin-like protein|nr:hypothetical protein [Acidimicrobiia bacterium]
MRGRALAVLALAALLTPLAALPARSTSFCFGLPTTMSVVPGGTTHGTAGDDVILGTAAAETIYGNGGKDRLCGGGGDDRLFGGPGRDRLAGGEGNDLLNDGAGMNQVLNGGAGNDTIRAQGYGDTAFGGPGDDTLISTAPFLTLRGNGGDDDITSDYRNDLDAGVGRDRCILGLGTPGTGCETVALDCGTGGTPLPAALPPGWTSATADFDGNGINDTLHVWNDGFHWYAHIETDGGFGAQTVLSTHVSDSAKALGGHDINGDGLEEVFLRVGTGASTNIVGLYTLYQPDPDEIPLFTCGLEPVLFAPAMAEASFVIGGSVMHGDGLQCRANHVLRQYQAETVDGTHWTQDRYNYRYWPDFLIARPSLWQVSHTQHALVSPADDPLIQLGYGLNCGGLNP